MAATLPEVPVDEAPLVFIDLEMTGLDPGRDRVCEVCLIRARGHHVEAEFESLVNPVDPGASRGPAQAIHGIPPEALDAAPPFEALAPALLPLLAGAVLVGHGVAVDEAFLRAELARLGQELPTLGAIDTLPLARRCFAARTYRLASLSRQLGLAHDRQHRAGDDARATQQLFWKMVADLAPASLIDLAAVRVGAHQARPHILEQARTLALGHEPALVRYRPSSRPVVEFGYVVTEVRADVDPPAVMGYLHPGRGRKELRADRILAFLPYPSSQKS